MALSKLTFDSINVTPAASKAIRFNSNANGFETASAGGSLTLIKTQTISSGTGTVSFVNGTSDVVLDDTYKEYIFFFNSIHGSANADPLFNFSIDTGSNYNVTKTTTTFAANHAEGDGEAALGYIASTDLAQSTAFQEMNFDLDSGGDSCYSGYLHLFEPSSTTFVKHFIMVNDGVKDDIQSSVFYVAGYGNTTSAVDAIQFKMASGNIDAGTISLYGVL
tara:strand:+ start:908 stop:1567 length:660 start_codon:yes stop_codon:yes gene_type:complete